MAVWGQPFFYMAFACCVDVYMVTGECAHEQHVNRTLTLKKTLTHRIIVVLSKWKCRTCAHTHLCRFATRQTPCRKRVHRRLVVRFVDRFVKCDGKILRLPSGSGLFACLLVSLNLVICACCHLSVDKRLYTGGFRSAWRSEWWLITLQLPCEVLAILKMWRGYSLEYFTTTVLYRITSVWSGVLMQQLGKSSESVPCAVLKACDACADMGQL